VDRLVALLKHLGDQALAVAVAVDIGGVDEIDAQVNASVQRGESSRWSSVAPHALPIAHAQSELEHLPAVPPVPGSSLCSLLMRGCQTVLSARLL